MPIVDTHAFFGAPPESVRKGSVEEVEAVLGGAKVNAVLLCSAMAETGDFQRGNELLDKAIHGRAPLNLARYLIEKKTALDPDWQRDSRALIEFVNRRFITVRAGVAVCGEQTNDVDPWGGILSTYGAVLAMYCKATGSEECKAVAQQALTYCLYAVNDDGCPADRATEPGRGGWQEDAHTDKLHNFMDAMTAFPEWGK